MRIVSRRGRRGGILFKHLLDFLTIVKIADVVSVAEPVHSEDVKSCNAFKRLDGSFRVLERKVRPDSPCTILNERPGGSEAVVF